MRLRTFTAPSIAEAMSLVRQDLGPDAVIISTGEMPGGGSTITAAIEEDDSEFETLLENATDPLEEIADCLVSHGVPMGLAQRLGSAALDAMDEDAATALANALLGAFRFEPLALAAGKRILLVGPPGAGKTVTTAKLAARQVMARKPVCVLSADMSRAGGVEQLAALTGILGLSLGRADGPESLSRAVARGAAAPVLIDGPGINPYSRREVDELRMLIEAAQAEPVLVLAAGTDPGETAEMVGVFAEIGARRLISTRLDAARRLGSLLAAADSGPLAFCEVGIAPDIADGLMPLTPLGLARLLLPDGQAEKAQPVPIKDASPRREMPPGGYDRGARR